MQRYRLPDPPPAGVVHTRSPEFLKVNPNGHIPSIDDDGVVLHKSLAINLYLAKKHGGPLAPANVAEDGEMTMWSLWAAIEVEGHAINIIYHRVSNAGRPMDPKIADEAVEALRGPFAVLDGRWPRTAIWSAAASPWPTSTWRRSCAMPAAPEPVRRQAEREDVARRLRRSPRLQEDVGSTRKGAGVAREGAGVATRERAGVAKGQFAGPSALFHGLENARCRWHKGFEPFFQFTPIPFDLQLDSDSDTVSWRR